MQQFQIYILTLNIYSDEEYLNDDRRTPFFHLGKRDEKKRTPKLVAETLRSLPVEKTSSTKPRRCQRNAAFIINVNFLDDPDDCLSDDLGSFRHNGHKRWYFVVEEDSFEEVEVGVTMEEGVCVLEKAYWMHSEHQDFRRRLWRLFDWRGKARKYVMLEYSFKGEECAIPSLPHHSSKIDKPFLRTEKSTKDRVKSLVKDGKRPSQIYDTVFEEKGGLMKAESPSSLPRHSQAANFKSAQKEDSQKDELWAIANLANKEVSNGTPFVRYIHCCTGNVFIADDRQLDNLQRFCTNPQHFGVLGVDTVFNYGNFYATPMTYPHERSASN